MKVIKPFNFSLLYKVFEARQSFFFCGAMICMFPFQQTKSLFADPMIWKFAGQELGKDAALDWVMPKPVGEVLITGQCHAGREKVAAKKVHLRIGPIDKSLLVFGDRHWVKKSDIAFKISDPEPFDRMPIRYEYAFGGSGYKKNPPGKGACAICDDQGRETHPLPNIESPSHVIGSPDDRPEPAGFGPLDMTWPQRMSRAGTYDDQWRKELFPGLAADIDMRFFNLAPKDQWVNGFFNGDEPIAVEGMHPEKEVLVSRLPGFRTRLFIQRQVKEKRMFQELETSLDTVWLFPHAERGILIFHGIAEIGTDDARDVPYCLTAYERINDEPRPLEHYQEALNKRLDKEKKSFYDLYDQDLIPPGEISGWSDLLKIDPDNKGPLAANLGRRAEKEKEKALKLRTEAEASVKKMLAASGMDPNAFKLPPLETPEPEEEVPDLKNFDPEQMAKIVKDARARAEKLEADARKDAGQKIEDAKAQIKQICEKHGLDYQKIMAETEAQKPKRPIQYAADLLNRLKETKSSVEQQIRAAAKESGLSPEQVLQQTLAATGGAASPFNDALDKMRALDPDDPELIKKLEQVEALTSKAYREYAHYNPPPKAPTPEEAGQLLQKFEAMRQNGDSFGEADLAGINLSGRDLSNINLAGAFLEGADLSGAVLSGADLTETVLAYADLTGVRAEKAKLGRANLGKSRLNQADFSQSDFEGAVLSEADLGRAKFINCRMDGMQFMETAFDRTDFSLSSLKKAIFIKPVMEGVSFKQANLFKVTMVEPRLNNVDFTGATAISASLIGVRAENTVFNHADFTKAGFLNNAILAGAKFHHAVLDKANFMGANLEGASLAKASLAKANLMQTNMKKADLTAVVARGAIFTQADLEGATLVGADLMNAGLRAVRLVDADLRLANLYSAEVFRAVFGRTNLERANLKMTKIATWERRPHE